jgi:hypothetical protein
MFSRLGINEVVRCLMLVFSALDMAGGRPRGEVAVMDVYEVEMVESWTTTCSRELM